MTEQQQIRVSLSESKGAIPGGEMPLSDGSTILTTAWGSACPGCAKVPAAGDKITKIFYAWYHANCGARYLRETGADEAWLALAHQLERSPSKFNNAETKAITRNLLRIAGRTFHVPESGHNDRVRGSRATLAAVPDPETVPTFEDVLDGFSGSDLYAVVLQAEQRNPSELAVIVGMEAWSNLDEDQQRTHFPEVLQAYVELVRIQREEDRQH